ncbi:MAG: hypothetical protein ABSC42_00040 [Tepidisphaeraceae bacterium]|jgi:hypothetical protein
MNPFFKMIAAIVAIPLAVVRSLLSQVRLVNRRYVKPEIELTRLAKVCLLVLRIYLLAMIVLMGYFLVQQVRAIGSGSLGHG